MEKTQKQEQRESLCKILRDKIENQATEIELFQQMKSPQRVMKTEQSILERRKKMFTALCSSK